MNCPNFKAAPRIRESFSTSRATLPSDMRRDPWSDEPVVERRNSSVAAPALRPAAKPIDRYVYISLNTETQICTYFHSEINDRSGTQVLLMVSILIRTW